jgi:hypothetical protein
VLRVGGGELPVGVVQPNPAQVAQGRGVQVAAERQLDGADGDTGGGRDLGTGDVVVGVLINERGRAPQRGRGGIAAIPAPGPGSAVLGKTASAVAASSRAVLPIISGLAAASGLASTRSA